jgi:hypothetical protein
MLDLDTLIENEIQKIYSRKWNFMKNDYFKTKKDKYHRKKIVEIPNIDRIKENVYNKLGSIAPFVFLTDFCNRINIPGPYNNIDKGLLILEHLLNGYSINQMVAYIPESNFYKIYQCIYITNREILEKWIDEKFINCFSNAKLRLLCAKKINPHLFNHVTLLLDGHHNKIIYQDINLDKRELYSYKLKTNGLNTQFIIDNNNICIYISESLPCKNNNDDNMFLNVKINRFFNETDCICFDGLYENTVHEVIEKYENVGYNISINNFCFPIRKDKNVNLSNDEADYNEQLGSFRSKIEKYFAELSSIFKRFNPQNKIRITDKNTYNIQLKLACVLLNMKYFTNIFKVEDNNHYNKWRQCNFDYYNNTNILETTDITLKTQFKLENIQNIKELQENYLKGIDLENISDNDANMEDIFIENSKQNEDIYEIQYIIKHKGNKNSREYYVKWKKYGKQYNSWVKEKDFIEKDILKQYWESVII